MSELVAEEVFRQASESIEVLAPPVDDVVALARAQRRRTRRTVVSCVVAGAVVLAGATWLSDRSSRERPDPGALVVTRTPNPVGVAWYAGGLLHLDDVTVRLPASTTLTDLAEVDGGAVYGDQTGLVAFVAGDGTRTVIGRKVAGAPLVASAGHGWAAWVDPSGDVPRLVVYAVPERRVLGRLDLSDPGPDDPGLQGGHPIAIDQDQVFYDTPGGDFAWTPPDGAPTPVGRAGLLDVRSGIRVFQQGGRIDMVQPFFSVDFARPGTGALVSPFGNYVLTSVRAASPGSPSRPLLYDTRSGKRLPSGVSADERAVDATFGDDSTVLYLVAQVADLRAGPDLDGNVSPLVVLRSCEIGAISCTDVVPVQPGGSAPLFAR